MFVLIYSMYMLQIHSTVRVLVNLKSIHTIATIGDWRRPLAGGSSIQVTGVVWLIGGAWASLEASVAGEISCASNGGRCCLTHCIRQSGSSARVAIRRYCWNAQWEGKYKYCTVCIIVSSCIQCAVQYKCNVRVSYSIYCLCQVKGKLTDTAVNISCGPDADCRGGGEACVIGICSAVALVTGWTGVGSVASDGGHCSGDVCVGQRRRCAGAVWIDCCGVQQCSVKFSSAHR